MKENILYGLSMCVLTLCAILIAVFTVRTGMERLYVLETEIVEIETITPIMSKVIVEDNTGNLWVFKTDDKVKVGNNYSLVMDNLGNDYLYDDVIELAIKR